MIEWKTKGTSLYQELPAQLYATLHACEPLREMPANRPTQQDIYKSWKKQWVKPHIIQNLIRDFNLFEE